jgi:hypothetical protein
MKEIHAAQLFWEASNFITRANVYNTIMYFNQLSWFLNMLVTALASEERGNVTVRVCMSVCPSVCVSQNAQRILIHPMQ